jgi:hypothetical protein
VVRIHRCAGRISGLRILINISKRMRSKTVIINGWSRREIRGIWRVALHRIGVIIL